MRADFAKPANAPLATSSDTSPLYARWQARRAVSYIGPCRLAGHSSRKSRASSSVVISWNKCSPVLTYSGTSKSPIVHGYLHENDRFELVAAATIKKKCEWKIGQASRPVSGTRWARFTGGRQIQRLDARRQTFDWLFLQKIRMVVQSDLYCVQSIVELEWIRQFCRCVVGLASKSAYKYSPLIKNMSRFGVHETVIRLSSLSSIHHQKRRRPNQARPNAQSPAILSTAPGTVPDLKQCPSGGKPTAAVNGAKNPYCGEGHGIVVPGRIRVCRWKPMRVRSGPNTYDRLWKF